MIKRILGEDNGLELKINQASVTLCPMRKNKITLYAVNSTEYDMHLYLSFNPPMNVGIEKRKTDLFVPAVGNSIIEVVLDMSADERMYMGKSILEFSVKDRVLEWTEEYELEIFTESLFKCSAKDDFSPCDELLFSRNGVFYLYKNECALIEAASEEDSVVELEVLTGEKPRLFADSKECTDGKVILKKGLTRLCIQSVDVCSVVFKDTMGQTVYLNTINTKYFL